MGSSGASSSGRSRLAAVATGMVSRPFSALLGGAGLRRPLAGAGMGASLPAASVASPAAAGGVVGPLALRAAWPAGGLFGSLWARFSSTLKKRRSKMNKHKLKKRRKLMRNKNKKNL